MHVVQVNCARDPLRRDADSLVDAWPTLGAVAAAVAAAGAEVTVVQSVHRNDERVRRGVMFRFIKEPWAGGRSGYAPMRLARAVNALKPDVVHVNGLGFPLHTRVLCARGAPVLVQDHADNPDSRARTLRRWGLAKISGVAFASRAQALPFLENGTLDPRVPVFEILESSTHFRASDLEAARRATGVYGDPVILWVGHLNENKDPLTVVEGFSRALPMVPGAHLWCCYRDAPLLDRVRTRLQNETNLVAHVHLVGPVDHDKIELYFRAADFFVSGSRREGCSYAMLESLACGATPIVTNIPAFRVQTGNGAVGALWKAGDPDALASALVSMAKLPKDVLRSLAVSHFQEELSFPVLGRKLCDAYESLIAARAARPR